MRRPAVKIFIPDALKSILVDDWEKVTKENKVAPTPAPISVTQFLNEYEESEMAHRRPGSADADILEEVIAGVKEYFNKALGRILLYRFERNQYFDWHKQLEKGHGEHAGKTLCDIYGCEHLLRLFGKILPAIRDLSDSISNKFHSRNARPGRTHQHGRPSRQQAPRGAL
jgi:mortality factor 4-like protein 1